MSFSLEIVSQNPEFKDRILKKYRIGDTDYVGAFGDEPFNIVFKNNHYRKVQVKLSLDGTDVISGDLADTSTTGEMWLVEPHSQLVLKGWPETSSLGAQFVFSSLQNSVSTHLHGDLSSRGIIAAAVYTEKYESNWSYNKYGVTRRSLNSKGINWNSSSGTSGNPSSYRSDIICGNIPLTSNRFNDSTDQTFDYDCARSVAAVGAGEQVDQQITKVAGLALPIFNSIVKVNYMWWDQLVEKLKQQNISTHCASGFPGDVKMLDLKNIPRVISNSNTQTSYDAKSFERDLSRFTF